MKLSAAEALMLAEGTGMGQALLPAGARSQLGSADAGRHRCVLVGHSPSSRCQKKSRMAKNWLLSAVGAAAKNARGNNVTFKSSSRRRAGQCSVYLSTC